MVLNFIFANELEVKTGDTIIVRVTEEPSTVFLLESWEVPCEFLKPSNPKKVPQKLLKLFLQWVRKISKV